MAFRYRVRFPVWALTVAAGMVLASCASEPVGTGKPPQLTFEQLRPLPVQAARVEIVNRYDPNADPYDVSAQFPTPPDIALRRFAERRLQSAGGAETLFFVIEDARVHARPVEQENRVGQWLGVGRGTRYDISVRLRLYTVSLSGAESPHSLLAFDQTRTLPDSLSIAEREEAQIRFLQELIGNVNTAVTEILQRKMNLASHAMPGSYVAAESAPLSSEHLLSIPTR